MSGEMDVSCAKPMGRSVVSPSTEEAKNETRPEREVIAMVKVGKKAPDFQAPAFYQGKFKQIKLSDYSGK